MIKITPADEAFSLCVRERAGWCCEKCGTHYPEGKRGGLHCSHFHGRANWSVRFDPLNAFAHCFGCHMYFEGNPHEFREWVMQQIGEGAYQILLEKKNNISLAKIARKTKGKGEIAAHYRQEHKRIKDQNERTFIGWL